MMQVTESLSNVNYFYSTVLLEARLLADWQKESIDKAFHWADYCEEVYKTASGHASYKTLINQVVGGAGKKSKNFFSFGSLKKASRHLLQAFIKNELLGESSYEYICQKGTEKGFDVNKMKCDISEMKALSSCLVNELSILESSPVVSSHSVSLRQEMEAECLFEFIMQRISFCKDESEIEKWLDSFAKFIFDSKNSMEKFTSLLLLDFSNCSSYYAFQKVLLTKLLQKVDFESAQFNKIVACSFWALNCNALCEISRKYEELYKCYINMLLTTTRWMEVKSNDSFNKTTWSISDSPVGPDYSNEDIFIRIKNLATGNTKSAKDTKSLISSLSGQAAESHLWAELSCALGIE